jgi:hypothetical protein
MLKKNADDVIEMYSKFYREFQERDFDLDTDKTSIVVKTNVPCFRKYITACFNILSCPIEGFHRKAEALLREKFM